MYVFLCIEQLCQEKKYLQTYTVLGLEESGMLIDTQFFRARSHFISLYL